MRGEPYTLVDWPRETYEERLVPGLQPNFDGARDYLARKKQQQMSNATYFVFWVVILSMGAGMLLRWVVSP